MQTVTNNVVTNSVPAPTSNVTAKASGDAQTKMGTTNGNTLPSSSGDSVTLSEQAKSLLADEQKQKDGDESQSMQDTVTSFAHGALGMDHPDAIDEQDDSSYSAGQYASAAITVGSILLALV